MLNRILCFLCMLWVGVMAGFFFAFTTLVMPGLGIAEPLAAMGAMQSINEAVSSVLFGLGFFGAVVLCVAVILVSFVRYGGLYSMLALAGAAIYVVGVFGVTVGFNVPLNEMLATLDPNLQQNAPAMTAYIEDWTFWNNVRTLANVLAFGLLASSEAFGQESRTNRGSPAVK